MKSTLLNKQRDRVSSIIAVPPFLISFLHVFVSFVLIGIDMRVDSLQISFQEFKNKLLEPGLVDHIVVSDKSVAKVYVRNTIHNGTF